MKKNIIICVLAISLLIMITGCNKKESISSNKIVEDKNSNKVINSVKAIIEKKEYTINLENNSTAKSFANMLPQELTMSELNGNEKYVYLDNTLPENSSSIKKVIAGDVMLYGNNCLVILYKSFNTLYSYTKIGHIDNLPDLNGDRITVLFKN